MDFSADGIFLYWWIFAVIPFVFLCLLLSYRARTKELEDFRKWYYNSKEELEKLKNDFSNQESTFKLQSISSQKISEIFSNARIYAAPIDSTRNIGVHLSQYENVAVRQARAAISEIENLKLQLEDRKNEIVVLSKEIDSLNKELQEAKKDATTSRTILHDLRDKSNDTAFRYFAHELRKKAKCELPNFAFSYPVPNKLDRDSANRFLSAVKQIHHYDFSYIDVSANISGPRETYTTSLTSCTCPDFHNRHRSCKHMMMLAISHSYLSKEYFNKNAYAICSMIESSRSDDKTTDVLWTLDQLYEYFPWLKGLCKMPKHDAIQRVEKINKFLMSDENMYTHLLNLSASSKSDFYK